ncbi:hypothetical protein SprV_0602219700 [Sparganum proliferum]
MPRFHTVFRFRRLFAVLTILLIVFLFFYGYFTPTYLPNLEDAFYSNSRQLDNSEMGTINAKLIGHIHMPEFDYTKEKVAIIVPYRNRSQQLLLFLTRMWPFLSRQRKQYVMLIVEQHGPESFNRAKLFNVAVKEIRQSGLEDRLHGIDCFLLHDVDKVPTSPTAVYECGQNVKQLATTFRSPKKMKRPDNEFVGAVTAFRWEHVEKINGASNMFYGRGGEDDLWYRLKSNRIPVDRPSENDGVFDDFGPNDPPDITAEALELLKAGDFTARWKSDGLNQTRYKLLERHDYNFFIWLLVSI